MALSPLLDGKESLHEQYLKTAISAMQELQQYKQLGTLEELRTTVGEWIPCSERLPDLPEDNEPYKIYMVTLDNGDVCLGVYRNEDKEWYTRMSQLEFVYSTKHDVLAWMPLPEPYRPEGRDEV